MAKASYQKPASQVDLEERQKSDYVPSSVLTQGGYNEHASENGFVGTDPIYQNFANDTEKPYQAEKGAEAKAEADYYSEDADFDAGATPQGESDVEEDEEEEQEEQSGGSTTPSSSTTPPSGSTPPSS